MKYFIFFLFILIATCAPQHKKKLSFGVIDFSHTGDDGRYSVKIDSVANYFIAKRNYPVNSGYTYFHTVLTPDYFNKIDSMIMYINLNRAKLDTLYENKSVDGGYFKLIYNDFSGNHHFVAGSGGSPKPLELMAAMIDYIKNNVPLVKIDTIIDFQSRHDKHITIPPPPYMIRGQ